MHLNRHIAIALCLLILASALPGCAHRGPVEAEPAGGICRPSEQTKKSHVRVGIYLNDDMIEYVYERRMLGITFKMHAGESFLAVWKEAASSGIFRDAVFVTSLPPYDDAYIPDVGAVVEPQLLYFYGDVSGTVSGHLDARVRMRVTVYDLAGNTLWKEEETGVSRRENVDLAGNYLGILEKADKTAYEAAFSASAGLMNGLEVFLKERIPSAGKVEDVCTPGQKEEISGLDFFRQCYEAGELKFGERKFLEALDFFEKAARANPADLSTLFYLGACYTYTGNKDKALRSFRKFRQLSESAQEISDSDKWIEMLKNPLRIGVVGPSAASRSGSEGSIIRKTLADSRMYEVEALPAQGIPSPADGEEFDRFLEGCFERGIRILIFDDVSYDVQKALAERLDGADVATEYAVRISAKVYSTRRRELMTEIETNNGESAIRKKTHEEESAMRDRLLAKATRALILRLLENDIF